MIDHDLDHPGAIGPGLSDVEAEYTLSSVMSSEAIVPGGQDLPVAAKG